MKFRSLLFAVVTAVVAWAPVAQAGAITINDGSHDVTIPETPERVVVLEFSFADSLASIGVPAVGVADDNDPKRLPAEVRNVLGDFASVGKRAQPSIEAIAALKPDLIIADVNRHTKMYDQLAAIAPTLLLPSRGEDYAESLESARIVAKAVGKRDAMQARLEKHADIMASYAEKVPDGASAVFAVAREDSLSLHGPDSYDGSVLEALGLEVPDAGPDSQNFVGLEQFLSVNPQYFMVGDYRHPSIVDKWQKEPLWQMLTAVKQQHVYHVAPNAWARNRGIMAAEKIAADVAAMFDDRYQDVQSR
ncbi:ABC transporter substrate-binding protein [Cobetia amphilecti]|nr:ABC transporter substrate-binding protein [Cobetia amphilecti]